jgi:hypothetical protein
MFGARDLQRSTAALNDAAYRLSRYFLTQLALNTAFGAVIAIGLFAIGVPNAMLWGIVAALMRFVPYVGGFIAAGGPALLAIAVDPGWSMALSTLALFAVAEPFMGQVVEPWVYGHSTGVSSLAIIVAAMFWTLLWGPVGLLLSTPLTVCLVVLGRHVDQLQFLDVLLGDRPALAPEQTFYQRLLAGDPIEIADQAEVYLQSKSLLEYYDDVALKGLVLAQKDVKDGLLDAAGQACIIRTIANVIEDLDEHEDTEPPEPAAVPAADDEDGEPKSGAEKEEPRIPSPLQPHELARGWGGEAAVLCVAGTNGLDEAAAAVLVQLLRKRGIGARVISWKEGQLLPVERNELRAAKLICLSLLDPSATHAARYLAKRVRRQTSDAIILVGLWSARPDRANGNAAKGMGADLIATSFRQGLAGVVDAARKRPTSKKADTEAAHAAG